jgi:CRP/FNR family transcriptional regulator, cyclic AMP receptor protein
VADEERDALRAVPLFAGLSEKDLDRVEAITKRVEHPAGKAVVEEDQSAVGFHLILEGTAETSAGGTVLSTLAAGDYFGEISLLDGQPRSATVTATSDLITLAIPEWNFSRLVDEHPEMMKALLIALCSRVRILSDR